jgi:menaquinone-dependent protoporphyrinogen oxidase
MAMAERILIAYATKCGSSSEVAEAVGEELASRRLDVGVRPIAQADHVAEYDAVVVGCPILYASPHSDAVGLLHRHRAVLARLPVAYFLTCLELTRIPAATHRGVPIVVDPGLGALPRNPGKLSHWERSHLVSGLVDQLLDAAPDVTPVSVGVFRGRMRYSDLNPADRLLMRAGRLLFSVPAGDFRNWPAIRSWAADLPTALLPAGRTGN